MRRWLLRDVEERYIIALYTCHPGDNHEPLALPLFQLQLVYLLRGLTLT